VLKSVGGVKECPQRLKPLSWVVIYGTAEAVPLSKTEFKQPDQQQAL
jgi:hypothetical protein